MTDYKALTIMVSVFWGGLILAFIVAIIAADTVIKTCP